MGILWVSYRGPLRNSVPEVLNLEVKGHCNLHFLGLVYGAPRGACTLSPNPKLNPT